MPTLRDISRRIRSVEKTQQITSAMRMVAAAKLRRAQDAIIAARPYSTRMFALMSELSRRNPDAEHPLLEEREQKRTLELLVITSDRGLCGAFNANAVKHAEGVIASLRSEYQNLAISVVGRKGNDYFRRRYAEALVKSWIDIGAPTTTLASEIAEHLATRFREGEVDQVRIVGNRFVSALSQPPGDLQLLPLLHEENNGADVTPYEIEPDGDTVLRILVPQALEFTIFRGLLESQAGEYAARMTAMESATRNTEELIRNLTLTFNRVRQAAITRELVEIVSGADAL